MCFVFLILYLSLPQLILGRPETMTTMESTKSSDCGLATLTNRYPWIVAIYDKTEKLICTGTIISPFHVVTAARCFVSSITNDTLYTGNPANYTIIAGRHYSNIHRTRMSQQIRVIDKMVIFLNVDGSFIKEDSIFIEVDKAFEFLDDIRPACLDFSSSENEINFKDGNEGIVVGWKYENDEVVPCATGVQYWQKNICRENLPDDQKDLFEDHFNRKFCVRYVNNNSTCRKDPGMGLFFKSKQQRHFLKGITNDIRDQWKGYLLSLRVSNVDISDWKTNSGKTFQFTYGTFGKEGGCVLPEHLQYGKFSLVTGSTYPENTWVPSGNVIVLSCEANEASAVSFRCVDNDWYPLIDQAFCRKPGSCPTLPETDSEKVFCKLNGASISCDEPPSNTTAVVVCQPYHTLSGQRPIYKCENSKWDPPFTACSLECGTKRVDVTTLAVGGTDALKNEYPWVVAVYNKDNQICGGSLISRQYVLSAAHCFTNNKGVPKNTDNFTIIAGKYFRDVIIEEPGSQKRKIKTLHIHEDYKGILQKYRDDIALIELDKKFIISLEVQPVCIDWESTYEDIDLTVGKMGVVAGWGFTQQGGSPSDVLKKLNMPFQSKEVCSQDLPEEFGYQFIATDKICAGYKDENTSVCQGDSGAGLYFRSDELRYFIRGIVSLTVKSTVGCDINHYSLFTKISKYLPWIENITRKIV